MHSSTVIRSFTRRFLFKTLGLMLLIVSLTMVSETTLAQTASTKSLARFHTDLGDMDVMLSQDVAPLTVANFFHYVTRASGAYNNSFIHRSVPGFVFQGGGYKFVN